MNTTNKETGIETPATASVEAPIDVMEADEVINTKKPKRQKRKIVIILLAILLLLIIGYRIFQTFAPSEVEEAAVINVKVAEVEYGSITASSPITGRIEPVEEVTIVPMTSGEVTRVYVQIGDRVSKGTVLFDTDKTQMAASYNQANASYIMAKKTYENMRTLYNEGAVSLHDLDSAQVQYESALAAYTSASEGYSNTSVTSPIDGYVTSLNVSVGSMAAPGSPVASVADVSSLVVNTTISEYLVSQLKVGDPVEILVSTLSGNIFQGKVSALSPAPAKGTLTYPVEFSVEDTSNLVKAGMFAEVRIVSAEKDHVLMVPSEAVLVKNGEALVVVINKEMPEYRKVLTGLDNGAFVEIINGLKEGETIVVEGQQYITENVKVNTSK